jgi:hypothetical protein
LFTRDFKKFRVALGAVAAAVLLYAGINAGFLTLSQWVESKYEVYPYREEDWLRYLLPGLFQNRGHNRIMLVGESAVLEGLVYEEFDRAFPKMRTFQGAVSAATLDDLITSLEYVEKVYGRDALPRVLVLGISPRFVANFPDGRFFLEAIRRYSPYFGVEETPSGPRLVPKVSWEGWLGWLRFVILKPQKRYLASLTVLARKLVSMDSMESSPKPLPSKIEVLRLLVQGSVQTLRQVARAAVTVFDRWWASPYRLRHLQPVEVPKPLLQAFIQDQLGEPGSVLRKVRAWNPETSRQMIADRFRRLRDFTGKREIRLFVFNRPARVEDRQTYGEGNYQRYIALVRENLGDTPYLDLRELLDPSEFHDLVHPTLPGAKRVTERVIRFIREHRDGTPELAD